MFCQSPTSTRIHFMHQPAARMRRAQHCTNIMQGGSCSRSSATGCEPPFACLQAAFAAAVLLSFLLHISFVYFLFSLLSFRFIAVLFATRIFLSTVNHLDVGNKAQRSQCCKTHRSSKKQEKGTQEQGPKSEQRGTTKEMENTPKHEARKACSPPTLPHCAQNHVCHPAAKGMRRRMQFANKMQHYGLAREEFALRRQQQQPVFAARNAGRQQLLVNEHSDQVELSIDVPGVKANDLNLTIDNRVLTITGSRATSGNNISIFSRKFALDTTAIDAQNLSANLIDGVLTVTAPKIPVKPSSAAPIQIIITTNETEDVLSTPMATPLAADSTTAADSTSSTTAFAKDSAPISTGTSTVTTEHLDEEPGVLGVLNVCTEDLVEHADSDDNGDNDDDDDDYVLMVETSDVERDVEVGDETVLKS